MINTREIAEEYRLSHWAQIMQERVQSGLSIKEYCKQIGICGNTYFYWQRRVRVAAIAQIEQAGVAIPPMAPVARRQAQTALATVEIESTQRSSVPTGWVQAQAEEEPESIAAGTLTIEIGSCRVPVSESTDTALLEKVCRVLSGIC